jgi:hypothetical protein
MASGFDEVERILDQHARRLARHLGGLLVDVGEAIRKEADNAKPPTTPPTARPSQPKPTKNDLLREAAALGIRGRSAMSKAELERAIRARRSAGGAGRTGQR